MSTAIVKASIIINIIETSVANAQDNLQADETAVEAPFGLTLGDNINKVSPPRPNPFDEEVAEFSPAIKAIFDQLEIDNPGFQGRAKATHDAS